MHPDITKLHAWLTRSYDSLGIELLDDKSRSRAVWLAHEEPERAQLLDRDLGTRFAFHRLTQGVDVGGLVEQDVGEAVQWLTELDPRSDLPDGSCDSAGAWQVHLVWIVDDSTMDLWKQAVRTLRISSGRTEEFTIDLVSIPAGSDVTKALDAHGLPGLLFRTRALLKLDATAVPAWLSPDFEFAEELRRLPLQVEDADQREFTTAFVERCLAEHAERPTVSTQQVSRLSRIDIENFRNIVDATIDLSGTEPVEVQVFHGPNGTGKSTLFEALSLALFGVSLRVKEFVCDEDIIDKKTRAAPLRHILQRHGAPEPVHLSMGGSDKLSGLPSDAQNARDLYSRTRGTLLSQEEARDYLRMEAMEFAALVLGDYSLLARTARETTARESATAEKAWQEWLREKGLNANITRREKILERLVERAMKDYEASAPLVTPMTRAWLPAVVALSPRRGREAQRILDRLDGWAAATAQAAATERVMRACLAVKSRFVCECDREHMLRGRVEVGVAPVC